MAHTAFSFALALGAILVALAELTAYEFPLTPRAVTEALTLAQSGRGEARAAFHRPYRITVGRAPVDYIEIVTPFRRVELAAEVRVGAGERLLSQREALAIAGQAGDVLELHTELTFHPLNTFVGVPSYDVTLVPLPGANPPIEARDLQRVPRFGMRVEGTPLPFPFPFPSAPPVGPGSQPLTGGTVIATFDGTLLERTRAYDVVVGEKGSTLTRVRVDLAGLR